MANITITIPDARLALLLDSIANQYGWVEEPAEDDPAWDPDVVYLTKAQFAHDAGMATVNEEMDTW